MKNRIVVYFGFNPLKGHKRGVENVILNQIASLTENDVPIYISLDSNNEEYSFSNIQCYSLKNDVFLFFRLNFLLFNLLVKNSFNNFMFHSHNYKLSCLSFFKLNIFTVHDALTYQMKLQVKAKGIKKIIYSISERFVYFRAKKIHFISQFALDNSLYNVMKNKHVIIYNTTPFERVEKNILNQNIQFPQLPINFYFAVRSIEERANIELLINLAECNPEYYIVIAGKGPLLEYYQQQISDKKLINIKMLGYVNDDELCYLYSLCSLVIVTALYGEGFGLPVIEGYLFDKPVVASNVCALPEVIIDQMFLFDNTILSLKLAIENVARNQKDFAFKNYYYSRFSFGIFRAEFAKLYASK